jgi:hypothetical protein
MLWKPKRTSAVKREATEGVGEEERKDLDDKANGYTHK